jgi:hypothetical protein
MSVSSAARAAYGLARGPGDVSEQRITRFAPPEPLVRACYERLNDTRKRQRIQRNLMASRAAARESHWIVALLLRNIYVLCAHMWEMVQTVTPNDRIRCKRSAVTVIEERGEDSEFLKKIFPLPRLHSTC